VARTIKSRTLAARADKQLFDEVTTYTEEADVSMGELIRKALREYMWAHPIKKLEPIDPVEKIKPKED